MTTSPLPSSRCPSCLYEVNDATCVHGADGKPKALDASVCLNCGQILIYTPSLEVRRPTAVEIKDLMNSRDAWEVIEKAQKIIQDRGRFK